MEMAIIRKVMLTIILIVGTFAAFAQQHDGEQPDFKLCFEILNKNRAIYNQYNDSIFLIDDQAEWINFFRRRAVKNRRIFLANKELLNSITDYFSRDVDCKDTAACFAMFDAFYNNYYTQDADDPFINQTIYNILHKYDNVLPEERSFIYYVNRLRSSTNYHKWNMTRDSTCLVAALKCENKILIIPDLPLKQKLQAYLNICHPLWLKNHIQTYNDYCRKLDAFRKDVDRVKHSDEIPKALLEECEERLAQADEKLIFEAYLADQSILDQQLADSLMAVILDKNLKQPRLNNLSYFRTLILQEHFGKISSTRALDLATKRCRKVFANVRVMTPDDAMLDQLLKPYFELFYINDVADISLSKKRHYVKRWCKDITRIYRNRLHQQRTTAYIKNLNDLFFYEPLARYLTQKERVRFLDALCVATQVTTYAHSVHVEKIADRLMKGVLKYQPELLVGTLDCNTIDEVMKNKRKYLTFIKNAAMYHDIGKNSITSVVNNEYRPNSDSEFHIIKRHPELGVKYLSFSKNLEKYVDTMLGHHKWYNGKGGYPESFDNTKSPVRILIDIVTLSDCMQAATETIGRNYKQEISFDEVMAEFRRDAGTRYNPDLVALIDSQPKLSGKLSKLVEEGWISIYFNIYRKYFIGRK